MKTLKLIVLFIFLFLEYAPAQENFRIINYSPPETLLTLNNIKIFNSGFGSALSVRTDEPGYFYLLTDRGPNFKEKNENIKIFPLPLYTPRIGKFKVENNNLVLVKTILLKDKNGNGLTGIPGLSGNTGTGERAIDFKGNVIPPDNSGIDSEGLIAMNDGSFWVSDEYGPCIIHFASDGKMIEEVSPHSKPKSIPKVFSLREPNKGMEGLTITPDGKYLVGIMQAPLINPDKNAVKKSKICRILFYEIKTGENKQYAYVLDDKDFSISDITAINDHSFLVIERDGKNAFGKKGSKAKNIYKIDIGHATDISDPGNNTSGKTINGKTIEELKNYSGLIKGGIIPVNKELFLNLLNYNYPHDKLEGIAIINDSTIAVSNDDDFGIDSNVNGEIVQKMVSLKNGNKIIDRTDVYFIKTKRIK